MFFEGIVANVLEYEYGPKQVTISYEGQVGRVCMNVSQEARSALEDLREQELVNALSIPSEDFQPIAAFQVSLKGLQFLKTLPNSLFEEVNSFVYVPQAPHYDTELLESRFDGETFVLRSRSGYVRASKVTEAEESSYVTSPSLPVSLRTRWGKPLTNNNAKAGQVGVKDINAPPPPKGQQQSLSLSYVTNLLGEWIPIGANNIVALNERLGSFDRCQGGMFTNLTDKNPTDTNFKVPVGLTGIRIIDFDQVHFVNFEADIRLPEDDSVVQIEHFALHMNRDGTVFYGMKMESIEDVIDVGLSVDALCRVVIDAIEDSSKIMDHLMTSYQRSAMNVVFMGDADSRSKFTVVIADDIMPKKPAKAYMDRGPCENEMKQIIGNILLAEDIGELDVLIIGVDGILMAGPSAVAFEPLVLFYVALACRENFVRSFFQRIFVLIDTTNKIRLLMEQYYIDPRNLERIRMAVTETARDIIYLEEIVSFLEESVKELSPPQMPEDSKSQRLQAVLNVEEAAANVRLRIRDLNKLVEGAANQIANLQDAVNKIDAKMLEREFRLVQANTKVLVNASAANERASAALSVMNIVLAGNFAFDIVDRVGGTSLNMAPPQWCMDFIITPLLLPSGMWFAVNMAWMAVLCYVLVRLMRNLENKASGPIKMYARLNKKLKSEDGLLTFLATKVTAGTTTVTNAQGSMKEVEWREEDPEKWLGATPYIEMVVDDRYWFLISVTITIDSKTTSCSEEDLVNIFLQDLVFSEAMDRREAFGDEVQAGEIERALAISKMQGAAGTSGQKTSMLNWLRGGARARAQNNSVPLAGPPAVGMGMGMGMGKTI